MNFIKSFFKSGTNQDSDIVKPTFPWTKLEDSKQLDEIVKASQEKSIVIFKHSTRCGVSRAVLKTFEKQTENLEGTSFYHLDLLKHRDISNAIAEKFELVHQSPQLLLIKKGKLAAADSHYSLLKIAI